MSRRVLLIAAAALGAGGLAIALWPSDPAPASDAGVAVLVARRTLPADAASMGSCAATSTSPSCA